MNATQKYIEELHLTQYFVGVDVKQDWTCRFYFSLLQHYDIGHRRA